MLTICFAVAFSSSGLFDIISRFNNKNFITAFSINLFTSFIAVLTAFVLHEIGHKIAANYYGYPAAFAYSKNGLIFAAIISLLLGILFAAPGAVIIYGRPSKKENGIISLAGPLTNLVVAFISMALFIVTILFFAITGVGDIAVKVFLIVASINIFIGAFNMIPIGVLDGAKILRWNKFAYFAMVLLFLPGIVIFFVIF